MAQNNQIPFLDELPKSPDDWFGLWRFLVSVKNTLIKAVGNPSIPDVPQNLKLTVVDSGGVQLSWSPANNASAYRIYRAQSSTAFTSASCVATLQRADNVSYFDGSQKKGAAVTYWVLALNKIGTESPTSVPVTTVDPGTVAPGSITNTEISDNSISTPKLQANSVTAAKITVSQLSAISADLGTITAGTVTGATLQTASGTGARVVIDSTNGLRAFDSSNVLKTQIPVSGLEGVVRTTLVQGVASGGVEIAHGNSNGSNLKATISGAGVHNHIGSNTTGYSICQIKPTTGAANAAMFFVAEDDATGQQFFAVNDTSDATKTAAFLFFNGTLYRVNVDNSDLGSGVKRYLYLNGTT